MIMPKLTEKTVVMKRYLSILSFAFCLAIATAQAQAQAQAHPQTDSLQNPYIPTEDNIRARETFSDSRFGIFIHWGLYSMLGRGEWVMHNEDIDYRD